MKKSYLHKIIFFQFIFLTFFISHSYAQSSLDLNWIPKTPSSWVFDVTGEMSHNQEPSHARNDQYILDFLPNNRILFTAKNPKEPKSFQEQWYKPEQSISFFLPAGEITEQSKSNKILIKGLGETSNTSRPDVEFKTECSLDRLENSSAFIKCHNNTDIKSHNDFVKGRSSEEELSFVYDLNKKFFLKVEKNAHENLGDIFGAVQSHETIQFNVSDSARRSKQLQEVFNSKIISPSEAALIKAQKETASFPLIENTAEKEIPLPPFAKGPPSLEKFKTANNDAQLMDASFPIFYSKDEKILKAATPLLIEKLKTAKSDSSLKVEKKFITQQFVLQLLVPLTFQNFETDTRQWQKWWSANKEKSIEGWAADSVQNNPVPLLRIMALRKVFAAKRVQDIPLLKQLLKSEIEEISSLAASALAEQKDKESIPYLVQFLDNPKLDIRSEAFESLAHFSNSTLGYKANDSFLDRQKSVALWNLWLKKQSLN